jgi:hypothetical protein
LGIKSRTLEKQEKRTYSPQKDFICFLVRASSHFGLGLSFVRWAKKARLFPGSVAPF